MGLGRALGAALHGVEGVLVEVEADLAQGLPALTVVGLPDAAVTESRDRVRAAVVNSGETWPSRRITVNLSPATLHKRGSGFDLPVAVAVLAGAGVLPPRPVIGEALLVGELGLDGRLRSTRGVLPVVLAAAAAGVERVVVPEANAAEAALVPGVEVIGARSLRQVLALLRGQVPPDEPAAPPPPPPEPERFVPDLADVAGQLESRLALEVAAAGGHHLFLLGPPGAGKTMLAERLPGVLPDLDHEAGLEVTSIHSVAGLLAPGEPLVRRPPFAAPHHTASVTAVVGGGSGVVRPGLVSLAHHGVLFADEAPEFRAGVLDALRQPLESGQVLISRAGVSARLPARFMLVLAANPCPCGQFDATNARNACTCTPHARRRYLARLSGPLLDRVDLRVNVRPVTRAELALRHEAEPTAVVAARVREARERARARFRGTPWRCNGQVPAGELRRRWPLPAAALEPAERLLGQGQLSARGVDRVLRVAWTLADLAARDRPAAADVEQANLLRSGAAA